MEGKLLRKLNCSRFTHSGRFCSPLVLGSLPITHINSSEKLNHNYRIYRTSKSWQFHVRHLMISYGMICEESSLVKRVPTHHSLASCRLPRLGSPNHSHALRYYIFPSGGSCLGNLEVFHSIWFMPLAPGRFCSLRQREILKKCKRSMKNSLRQYPQHQQQKEQH